jgi:hypothetical protein
MGAFIGSILWPRPLSTDSENLDLFSALESQEELRDPCVVDPT